MRVILILLLAALALYLATWMTRGSSTLSGVAPTPIAVAGAKARPSPTSTVKVREIKGTPIYDLSQLDSKPFHDPGLEPQAELPEAVPSPESPNDIESQLERLPLPTLAVTPKPAATPSPAAGSAEDPAAAVNQSNDSEQQPFDSNGLISGIRRSLGFSAVVEPTATPTPTIGLPRVAGQPRGYTQLVLMQPQARPSAEAQIENLLKAQVSQVYLGVLTDGTFGWDQSYLENIVRRLNSDGRSLTLVLYITNGATMRAWDRTPIDVAFTQTEPAEFRQLIQYDLATRDKFQRLARRVEPIVELNRSLNPANRTIIIPMLEDNLDADSYRAIRSLTEGVFGARVDYIRNPCIGCYNGNDSDPQGDGLESHSPAAILDLGAGDGFSLDGISYNFVGENRPGALSTDTVKSLSEEALRRGLGYFGLWRAERQGVEPSMPHPDERTYEVPNEDQLQIERELLREGLIEVK